MRLTTLFSVLFICFTLHEGTFGEYYGKHIGTVAEVDAGKSNHDFKGTLFAVNETSVAFVNLTYDGKGPAARFWVANKGSARADNSSGKWTTNEHGSFDVLKKYEMAHIILTLPGKITEYSGVAIYCLKHDHNFGQVTIPEDFDLPEEKPVGTLTGGKNGVKAAEITLKDSATIVLQEFHYDGKGNDVRFAVGREKDDPPDELTKLEDENGNTDPLREYDGKTVTLRLPEMKHWNEYTWFTVYSFADNENLGEVQIQKDDAESVLWHDWEPNKRTTAATAAPKKTRAATRAKPAPSSSPKPPASSPSSPDTNSEESSGFPTVIAVGVGVGIVVCIATSVFLFCFRSSDKDEPAGIGGPPEVAAAGMAEGPAA